MNKKFIFGISIIIFSLISIDPVFSQEPGPPKIPEPSPEPKPIKIPDPEPIREPFPEEGDAEKCIGGEQCVSLGIEIAQLKANIERMPAR